MKKLLITLGSFGVIIGIVSTFIAINHRLHDIRPPKNSCNFAIYIARYTGNEDKLYVVDDEPIVTNKDIAKYHWSDHRIEFTKEFLQKPKSDKYPLSQGNGGGSSVLGTGNMDKAIIVVNGRKVYEAIFPESPTQAYYNSGSYKITDITSNWNIEITSFIKNKDEDKRFDNKIYNILKETGVLME